MIFIENMEMNIKNFWQAIVAQNAEEIRDFFKETAMIRWHNTNEEFTLEEFIRANYQIFLNRQRNCPRTLSNGDFLQFNAMIKEDKVFIIDWGFGGVMPYSLDIARFIAHATEDRATFPFYMNDYQKELFINRVYSGLHQKPEYEQYIRDINLALFNEYIEFIEAGEDENNWYREQAEKLAQGILKI